MAPHDPTVMPRWLFVMTGGFIVGGVWFALHSNLKNVEPATRSLLKRIGGQFVLIGAIVQLGIGFWVMSVQSAEVQKALSGSTLNTVSILLWAACALLTAALALVHMGKKVPSLFLGWAAPVTAFLSVAGFTIVRDGIRDYTLFGKGYDVWNRTENSNWFVIILFLLLFVIGLVAIYWLLSVMRQAQANSEEVPA
jgi:hypothetical protein